MSNIIDSIRLSGTTYQIQGSGGGITVDPTLDSGSTNPVANSAITTALGDKVNVADNNASAYTFENKIGRAEYGYSENFAGPIYIRYTGSTSSSGGYFAGNILCYTSEWGWESIGLYFNLSNGQITATTVSSAYFDIEIENGEAVLTFKDGFYLRQYNYENGFVALTKTTYESGQSADVIEDTVYDVFDKLNDKIDKVGDKAVTSSSMAFSNGYLNSSLYTNSTSISSSVKIDSSTIKSSNNGLSVQFAIPEAADKILNVGSDSYGQLFYASSYDTSINEFTITFNPNFTQSNVYNFSVRIIEASNVSRSVLIEYDSEDMSAEYTNLSTYCTVTDTLSTDYKLKVVAKEGYRISRLNNGNYMVGGVDNTNPNNYISNLVTTPSYVHDGQDVIDDIYDKLDDKQDTLVSSQNIKTINNQSLLGSGNIDIQGGGGKAIEAGRGISITTGETADTVSFNLPISAGTGYQSIAEGDGTKARGRNSHAEGDYTTAAGMYSHAEGSDTIASGESSHSEGDSTIANGDYSHAEGQGTKTSNQSEHASGQYNNSVSASTTFGDSGNTLFSVGNGTSASARHNALEIRQNGDIYLSSGGTDIKLQDHLGGSSITVDAALDSGSTNPVANSAITTALDDKQDTLVSSQNIKTINNESILGSGNINIQGGGGGKAVSGGTNISITTGETADTINCTLPITNRTNSLTFFNNSTVIGNSQSVNFGYSNSFGLNPTRIFNFGDNNSTPMYGNYYYVNFGDHNSLEGYGWDYTFGTYLKVTNQNETAFGKYNASNTGSTNANKTLFSVGNGTADNARHNAFEIRQNGDIYCSDGTNDVKLQDTITATASNTTALGGLSLVKLTQAEYDALATKDNSTLYVIVN